MNNSYLIHEVRKPLKRNPIKETFLGGLYSISDVLFVVLAILLTLSLARAGYHAGTIRMFSTSNPNDAYLYASIGFLIGAIISICSLSLIFAFLDMRESLRELLDHQAPKTTRSSLFASDFEERWPILLLYDKKLSDTAAKAEAMGGQALERLKLHIWAVGTQYDQETILNRIQMEKRIDDLRSQLNRQISEVVEITIKEEKDGRLRSVPYFEWNGKRYPNKQDAIQTRNYAIEKKVRELVVAETINGGR